MKTPLVGQRHQTQKMQPEKVYRKRIQQEDVGVIMT